MKKILSKETLKRWNQQELKLSPYDLANSKNIIEVAKELGFKVENDGMSCPFHVDANPSFKFFKKDNKGYCFSCQRAFSVVDLVAEVKAITPEEAVKTIITSNVAEAKGIEADKGKDTYQLFIDYSQSYKDNHRAESYIKSYLKSRGIYLSLSKIESMGIELRHNYYNDNNYVVYNFINYSFCIKKSHNLVNGSRSKYNGGKAQVVTLKGYKSNTYFLCEGIEDSLSVIQHLKCNVICLNSTSNVNSFIELVKSNLSFYKSIELVIATDNDRAGTEAEQKIIKELNEFGITCKVFNDLRISASNDLNEYFMQL